MNGQTPRSRAYWSKSPAVIEARGLRRSQRQLEARNFIYFLNDADGNPIYIGRSSNVKNRIAAHRGNQGHPDSRLDTSSWFSLVDHAETVGPFTWDEAVKREREEIEAHQPKGNKMFTARDHVASRRAAADQIKITSRTEAAS